MRNNKCSALAIVLFFVGLGCVSLATGTGDYEVYANKSVNKGASAIKDVASTKRAAATGLLGFGVLTASAVLGALGKKHER